MNYKNIDLGFIRKLDEKSRLIIPVSIVEKKRISDGQILYAQKHGERVRVFIKQPKNEEYISVVVEKGRRMILSPDSGFNDFFDISKSVRVIEFHGGFSIYPHEE